MIGIGRKKKQTTENFQCNKTEIIIVWLSITLRWQLASVLNDINVPRSKFHSTIYKMKHTNIVSIMMNRLNVKDTNTHQICMNRITSNSQSFHHLIRRIKRKIIKQTKQRREKKKHTEIFLLLFNTYKHLFLEIK